MAVDEPQPPRRLDKQPAPLRVTRMKRFLKSLMVPACIAIFCVGLLVLLQWWRPSLFIPLDIAAADHLFLREDGPHLGRRPAREDIVLVLIDAATSRARGGNLPSFGEDLALYQALIDAKSRVIADTRMVAAADEAAMQLVRPLLEGMRKQQDQAAVMRDVWMPVSTPQGEFQRFRTCLAPIVMNMHPNSFRVFETRLCPLVTYMNVGPVETMPLEIYRAQHGLARRDAAAVDAELYRCGIFVSWATRDDVDEYRTKYTAIGSTVNVASRLCDAAKPGEIIVSMDVEQQLAGEFSLERRPPIRVKGIERELEIHAVIESSAKQSVARHSVP